MRVYALLLAAGESARMGQPKALLPWQGGTLLEFQVEQILAGGIERVILVLGHEAERIQSAVPALPRTTIVVNPEYATGRTSSVRAGMDAIPADADAALVLSVDQPRPAALTRRLRQAPETAGAPLSGPGPRRGARPSPGPRPAAGATAIRRSLPAPCSRRCGPSPRRPKGSAPSAIGIAPRPTSS